MPIASYEMRWRQGEEIELYKEGVIELGSEEVSEINALEIKPILFMGRQVFV